MKLISALLSSAFADVGVDYSANGKNWDGVCASGKRQSPIAIQETAAEKKYNVDPFRLNNYSRDNTFGVTFDHSIKMTPEATDIT